MFYYYFLIDNNYANYYKLSQINQQLIIIMFYC